MLLKAADAEGGKGGPGVTRRQMVGAMSNPDSYTDTDMVTEGCIARRKELHTGCAYYRKCPLFVHVMLYSPKPNRSQHSHLVRRTDRNSSKVKMGENGEQNIKPHQLDKEPTTPVKEQKEANDSEAPTR